MFITQALKLATAKLKAKNINIPHLEAEILLSHILKKPREFLLAHGEKKLSSSQISNFKSFIYRHLKGEPIAYIIGHKEFYGLNFKINKNVLVPRPETELMVEEALRLITLPVWQAGRNAQPVTLADIGTGSGCVIITLAKKITNPPARRAGCEFLATDISVKALAIAKQNAKLNRVEKNIKFLRGNLLEPLTKILDSRFRGNDKKKILFNSKFIITANLPYLTPSQIKNSSSIKYEPKSALDGGPDGLKYYRRLFKQIKILDNACYLLCEIDSSQTAKIKQLIKRELLGATLQIKKDLSGLNRLVIISINQSFAPYNH